MLLHFRLVQVPTDRTIQNANRYWSISFNHIYKPRSEQVVLHWIFSQYNSDNSWMMRHSTQTQVTRRRQSRDYAITWLLARLFLVLWRTIANETSSLSMLLSYNFVRALWQARAQRKPLRTYYLPMLKLPRKCNQYWSHLASRITLAIFSGI